MSRLLRLVPALLPAVVFLASHAVAQGLTPSFQATLGNDDDKVISVCAAVIKSGGLTGNNLSMAFSNRGLGHLRKGEFDRSITDFNESIRINSKNAFAYDNRGLTFERMDNLQSARADYRAVLALKGDRPIDKWARGEAQRHLNRLDSGTPKK